MRQLNLSNQKLINEVATIHEKLLESQEANYKATRTSIALRIEMINARLRHCQDMILIIEDNQELQALIWGHFEKQTKVVTIELLFVYPKYRRQGFARQLKLVLEDWAMKEGAQTIQSTINTKNQAMLNLNHQIGYEDTHIKMKKDLK